MEKLKEVFYHIKGAPTLNDIGLGSSVQNYIKANVYYDKGGWSYLSYRETPRGYFMSVSKIGRGRDTAGIWESTALFSNDGARKTIFEVAKKSKKKSADAEAYFDANIESFLKAVFPDLELEKEEL